jgi:uncharacterized protein YydD (DUF2326 family)
MRLIQLTSSDSRFQTLNFDRGLNIIVGQKLNSDKKETSNGIGKSLSLICIDFMLGKGSQSKIVKRLKDVLKKEAIILSLSFEHNNIVYEVKRDHKQIWVNDKEYTKESKYIDFLNTLVSVDFSFREIFSRFFRTDKDSYSDAIYQVTTKEKAYKNNKINAFLLQLNLEFLNKKRELKEKSDRLKSLIRELGVLQKGIDKEREFEISERLTKIENDLESFEIAEDFNDLKEEADRLTEKIQKISNQIAILSREIRNKQRVIEVNRQSDIDIEKLKNMYAEASFFLGEDVLNHIDAVKEFHNTLFENRKKRALKDITSNKKKLQVLEEETTILDKRRGQIFGYLENKGALAEYHSLSKEKEYLYEQLNDMQSKAKLLKELKREQADIKLEIDKFKIELIDLEDSLKEHIRFLGRAFRDISEEFYRDKPGFLDIEIIEHFRTDKLYKIEPEIKADGSDGINEMKIFIYDMLVYKLNKNLIGLIGHDNRLFDMVDERQIAESFLYTSKNVDQYICSISDTKFKEAKKHSNIDLDDFIIMNLSENKKLFGFDFDK